MHTIKFVLLVILGLALNLNHISGQEYESFGEEISSENPEAVASVVSALEKRDSVTAKLMGTVLEVCQMKGCWMTVSDGVESDQNSFFVKFKDYGFFMPKDISGQEVIMDGIAYRKVTPVDELRHYAEDAGKSEEEISAITEPKEELHFMARGVLLKKEAE